ncbi:unnamed protein product [Medioppia subpectinata]|uniref:protein-tyrosine-phosphatase n=1 Tax=Medioppia subpectinata TaxID=1979941 RepID=A0A7R9LCV8_9ACAR|nr:unnamed protein product [Medioppia subpectinata]CAG2117365.1 unnamed protein product [Medioppia subpectinata]
MGKQGIQSTLKKVDTEPEIPDMDKIWDTLYLGEMSGALDEKQILWYNIKTIVTVMEEPIDNRFHCEGVAYHWIKAEDYEEEDLLTHFHEAYDIIDAAVTAKTGVLVHCRAGISRSATIVIAYLMRKLQKPYKEVRALVRSRRDCIEPNDGFVDQLLLFESMAYRLDANNCHFRQYLLQTLMMSPDARLMLYYERMSVAEKLTPDLDYGPQYVCTGCDEGLFNEIHVLKNDGSDMYKNMKVCGRVFIEPQRWMGWTKVTETVIRCQTCGQLVGRVGPTYPVIDCQCGHHMDVDSPLKVEMTANMFKKI